MFITHVNGINTDVFFDPAKNAAATYNPSTKTCTNVSCHGTHEMVWGGPSVSCLDCHDSGSKKAPPFSQLLHLVHLTGGTDNVFVATFKGDCRHCHKLDAKTGAWSMPSGPER